MEEVTSTNSGVTMNLYPGRKPLKNKGGSLPIEQVQAAMEAYIPPEGYDAVTVFAKGASYIYKWGVKLQAHPGGRYDTDKERHKWACHATHHCRTQGRLITRGANGRNTFSATNHLTGQHGISVPKSEWGTKERSTKKHKMMKPPHSSAGQPSFPHTQRGGAAAAAATQQARHWLLRAVHTYVTGLLLPPNHFEHSRVNDFFRMGRHPLEVERLHHKRVTHLVGELYLAKLEMFSTALKQCKAKSPIPPFHLSIDILKHEVYKESYLAIRIWWIDEWKIRSELVAIRAFQIFKYKNRAHGRKHIMNFIESVLGEFGLSLKDVSSLSTDGRPCFNWEPPELFEILQECCVPSLFDTVLIEALGLQKNIQLCNNEACRRMILAQVKVAQEFVQFSKSNIEGINQEDQSLSHLGVQRVLWINDEDKCSSRLRKSTSRLWESIVNLQHCTLKGFNAIEVAWYKEVGVTLFPLGSIRQDMVELYSLMKPIWDAMSACQIFGNPMGSTGLIQLIVTRQGPINPLIDLQILDPAQPEGLNAARRSIPHDQLTTVAQITRNLLAESIDRNFFAPRYMENSTAPLAFEMAMILNPVQRELTWLQAILTLVFPEKSRVDTCWAAQRATLLLNNIWEKVKNLAVLAAKRTAILLTENKLEKMAAAATEDQDSSSTPATKRQGHNTVGDNTTCPSPLNWDEITREMDKGSLLSMGLKMYEEGKQGQVQNSEGLGVHSIVQAEISSFRCASIEMSWKVKLAQGFLECRDGAVALEWWQQVGERSYPLLAAVAKSILTIPATSGVVERPAFSGNTPLMTWEKIAGDTSFTEMALYLNARRDEPVDYDRVNMQTMTQIKRFTPHALHAFHVDNGIEEYTNDGSIPDDVQQFINGKQHSLIHSDMWEEYTRLVLDIPI